ncbi:hypothetical protein [Rhodococcus sp. IEGM 1307]|uniref:hypothetical protein n=1 Tax=Rhodococcus sp. IEGM 1307 TaxID=3047091 RepID=UPI0024B66788|nr:hypothetical protein [Rhodococcus sp. IEGM 1307]MDI9977261.1 hypothetical protein [Rhodococcus sp. IEGM 1307]
MLEYQQQRRARQDEAFAQTTVPIDDEDEPAVVAEQLKIARKAVAERRRACSGGMARTGPSHLAGPPIRHSV